MLQPTLPLGKVLALNDPRRVRNRARYGGVTTEAARWSLAALGAKLLANWHGGYGVLTDYIHDDGPDANHATMVSASNDFAAHYIHNDAPAALAQTSSIAFVASGDRGVLATTVTPYSVLASTALTFSAWVKVPDLTIIRNIVGGADNWNGIDIQTDGTYRIVMADGSAVQSAAAITANEWTHICVTRSAANAVKLYKNGVLDANSGTNAQNWAIGLLGAARTDAGSDRVAGRVADIRIYTVELSASDVALLAAGGEPNDDPRWQWLCDNGVNDAAVSGDMVHRWISDDENALAFIQDTTALRPTLLKYSTTETELTGGTDMIGWELINARPAVEFDGSRIMRLAGAQLATCDEVFMVVKPRATPDDYQTVLASSDEAGTVKHLELIARGNSANPHPGYAINVGGGGFLLDGSTTVLNNHPLLLAFRSNAGAISLTLEGVPETLNEDSGSDDGSFFPDLADQDNLTVGGKQDSGGPSHEFTGHVYHIVACDGLTADERTAVLNYLTTRYLTPYDLIMDGDSIVTGTYEEGEDYYPISWADMLPGLMAYGSKPTNYYNTAEGGTFFTAMSTDPRKAVTLASIATAVAGGRRAIYCCQMGNGLLELSPTEYYRELKTFVAELRSAGALVAVAHIFHRDDRFLGVGNQGAPGWETGVDVDAFNEYLDNDPSLWDAILDWDGDYYASLDAANLTYVGDFTYYFDGIHQTDEVNVPAAAHAKRIIGGMAGPDWSTNSVAPAISGTEKYGETLTCSDGTWDQSGTKTYRWLRNGDQDDEDNYDHYFPIAGATEATYQVQLEDVDHLLKCVVGNVVNGVTAYASSDPTGAITADYGAELITDPGFASGSGWKMSWVDSPWTADSDPDVTGGVLTITQPDPPVEQIHCYTKPLLTVTEGEYYRVTVDFTESTGGNAVLYVHDEEWRFGPPVGVLIASRQLLSTGSWSVVFRATSTGKARISVTYATGYTPTADDEWIFDNISCKPLV